LSEDRAADIERRLDAGEWLRPGDVGVLFGRTRYAVDDWMNAGKLRFRRSPGGHREAHPEDVRRLLDEQRQVHGGTADD